MERDYEEDMKGPKHISTYFVRQVNLNLTKLKSFSEDGWSTKKTVSASPHNNWGNTKCQTPNNMLPNCRITAWHSIKIMINLILTSHIISEFHDKLCTILLWTEFHFLLYYIISNNCRQKSQIWWPNVRK